MPRRRDRRYSQPDIEPSTIAQGPAEFSVDWRDAEGRTWLVQDIRVHEISREITGMAMGWEIATHRTFRSLRERALYTFVDGDRHAYDAKTIAEHFARSKRLTPKDW